MVMQFNKHVSFMNNNCSSQDKQHHYDSLIDLCKLTTYNGNFAYRRVCRYEANNEQDRESMSTAVDRSYKFIISFLEYL